MRISDWSSDVCSSDLAHAEALAHRHHLAAPDQRAVDEHVEQLVGLPIEFDHARFAEREQFAQRELGRSDLDRQLDVDILEQLEIGGDRAIGGDSAGHVVHRKASSWIRTIELSRIAAPPLDLPTVPAPATGEGS